MNSILHDLKHGLRLLRRSPAFALAVIMIVGLGIGAGGTIFSFISSLMWRPLGIEDVRTVIRIYERMPGDPRNQRVSFRNFLDWQEQNQVFDDMAAYRFEAPAFADAGDPERVQALRATSTIFPLLRIKFAAGRGFGAAEDRPGAEPVVVLSQGFWKSRYASDPNVIGRTVRIEGQIRTIIGVLETDPEYFGQAKLWLPLAVSPATSRTNHFLDAAGRLKTGVTVERAQADMDAIALRLTENKIDDRQLTVHLMPLHDSLLQTVRAPMLLGMAAAAFLVLIACANVANLFLARGVGRTHEMAIRRSLGASRGRIIRQLTTESVLLSGAGGLAGLLVAYSTIGPLAGLAPENYRIVDVVIDARVMAFVIVTSVLSGVAFGLVPGLRITRPVRFFSRHRVRNLLIVSEVALALVLLVGAGLLMRSYARLQSVDPGFDPTNVLTMRATLPPLKYREALDEIRTVQGVQSAAVSVTLPFGPSNFANYAVEGAQDTQTSATQTLANTQAVSPDYFKVMDIRLLNGRYFNDEDVAGAPPVAIINNVIAQRFWPGGDAVGRRIRVGPPEWNLPWMTIVGVAGNVRVWGLDQEVPPEIYAGFDQAPNRSAAISVRTTGDPLGVAGAVRNRVQQLDRDQPVTAVRTMQNIMDESQWQRRVLLMVMTVFAVVALLLSSAGLYGVIAYSVSQRQNEIGIRMALGAQRREILRMAIAEGMKLTMAGVIIGAIAAIGLTRMMSGLLFGVSPNDLTTFAGFSLLLLVIAFIASYVPARRATTVDPVVVLRSE